MSKTKRIFVYGHHLVGDFLMLTPALRNLKEKFPGRELVYCTPKDAISRVIAENDPLIDNILTKAQGMALAESYDMYYEADVSRALAIAQQTGKSIPYGFCKAWGVDCDSVRYDLGIPRELKQEAIKLAKELAGENWNKIVLCARHSTSCTSRDPKIGKPNKCFDNQIWLEVSDWLKTKGFIPIAIGTSKDKAEDPRMQEWNSIELYDKPLMLVAALTNIAALTISVDTGIRHLTAASGGNLYCVSCATPLETVACVPNQIGQKLYETNIIVPQVTAEKMIADIITLLGLDYETITKHSTNES